MNQLKIEGQPTKSLSSCICLCEGAYVQTLPIIYSVSFCFSGYIVLGLFAHVTPFLEVGQYKYIKLGWAK